MAVEGNTWRAAKGLLGPVVSAAVLLAAVGGCSWVPDAINPVEWYKNTKDFFAEADDKKPAATESDKKQSTLVADRGKAPPGAGKPAPNLGSFPDKPPITRAERNRLTAQGLVSDSEGRRYASESIPRQGEPVGVLVPRIKAAMPDAPAAPSPPAMPTPPPAAPPPVAAPAAPPMAAPSVPRAALSASPPAAAVAPPPVTAPLSSRVRRPPAAAPVLKPPPGSVSVPVPGPFETLVISSTGVELAAVPLLASRPVAPPAPRGRVKIRRQGGTPRFGLAGAALPPGAVKVATIQYSNGSAELDARDRRILDEVFRLHRQRGGKMRIIGHASQRTRNLDPATHNMVNYRISAARADSVARELIGRGVRADEISVDARADREPIYYEFMPAGEAGNRRTEIYFER